MRLRSGRFVHSSSSQNTQTMSNTQNQVSNAPVADVTVPPSTGVNSGPVIDEVPTGTLRSNQVLEQIIPATTQPSPSQPSNQSIINSNSRFAPQYGLPPNYVPPVMAQMGIGSTLAGTIGQTATSMSQPQISSALVGFNGQGIGVAGSSNPTPFRQERMNLGPVFPNMSRDIPQSITGPTVNSLASFRQQMDESNHEMVHMFTQQMGAVITPIMEMTNNTCNALARQMARLNQAIGIDDTANVTTQANIPQVNVEQNNQDPGQIGQNEQPRLEHGNVHVLRRGDEDQMARNDLAMRLLRRNLGGQQVVEQNVNQVVEQVLNRFGFNVGYANQPYFV